MNVAWCVMALAFSGTDEPRTVEPAVCATRAASAESQEIWPMSLSVATRIALDNSKMLRVVTEGAPSLPVGGLGSARVDLAGVHFDNSPIVVWRMNANQSIWRFKSEVMALVRSVEQQYWNLAQAHAALASSEHAARMTTEVLALEQSEVIFHCLGGVADAAEAEERLEKMKLDAVNKTSDLITTERQFRTILGLPPADKRRIIPTIKPTEDHIVFDWDTCLSEMMEEQPDIRQQVAIVRLAELQLLFARNQLIPCLDARTVQQFIDLGPELESQQQISLTRFRQSLRPLVVGSKQWYLGLGTDREEFRSFPTWQVGLTSQIPPGGRSPLSNTRQAQYILLRSRTFEQQVVRQTTHNLARMFLEIDNSYKQFTAAQRLRSAAQTRLEAQRAYYDEGRITIDRFVDAISAYAAAVTLESQYKATYNISLAAMSEAKGTMLEDRNIVVAESARHYRDLHASQSKIDEEIRTAWFEPAQNEPAANTKNWMFSISNGWDTPLKINGSISVDDDASVAQ
jgi:outer membrane protein TolC